MTRYVSVLSITGLALFGHSLAFAVTFDDGGVHTIDAANSFPLEPALVMDGPGGAPTTVNVVTGGRVKGIEAFGASVINVSDGVVPALIYASDDSAITLSGGFGSGVIAQDRAFVDVSGGQWDVECSSCAGVVVRGGSLGRVRLENTVANISSGILREVLTRYDTIINMSGGTVEESFLVEDRTVLELTGGRFNGDLFVRDSSRATISGAVVFDALVNVQGGRATILDGEFNGSFGFSFSAAGGSSLTILGGTWNGSMQLLDTSMITLGGGGFSLPLGDVVALSGNVTGTLASGDAFAVEFSRASTARLVLAAPVDSDMDGLFDEVDNCPTVANPDQEDTDGDRVGDACNDADDTDGDEYSDVLDNCPLVTNPGQEDADLDLIGDVCDPFPNDPDNEQAQCDADLEDCLSGALIAECLANFAQCGTSLAQCTSDLGEYTTSLDVCNTDRATCAADLEQTNSDLEQCNADLSECLANGVMTDNDSDGEADPTDLCPSTPGNEPVDSDGCSHEEFCLRIDATTPDGRRSCRRADWRNDEAFRGNPRDCRYDRRGFGPEDDACSAPDD